jgi:hypothetical protein
MARWQRPSYSSHCRVKTLLEEEVTGWRERMLDLFGGFARDVPLAEATR